MDSPKQHTELSPRVKAIFDKWEQRRNTATMTRQAWRDYDWDLHIYRRELHPEQDWDWIETMEDYRDWVESLY